MKKTTAIFTIICILCLVSSAAFADVFDSLENLSPLQKDQLSKVYHNYKTENNSLETRIMEYTSKINELKNDEEKTPAQLSVLAAAYERNLTTLKAQQKKLEEETNSAYQTIMTAEQYKQYKESQNNVQDAFNNWLQK